MPGISYASRFALSVSIALAGLLPPAQGSADDGLGLEPATKDDIESIPYRRGRQGIESVLPTRVDLRHELPPPGSQGDQSSCVGWAVGYALHSHLVMRRDIGDRQRLSGYWGRNRRSPRADRVTSPAYVYNSVNDDEEDDGISIPAALDFLKDSGAATLRLMPYQEDDWSREPSRRAREQARKRRIKSKHTVQAWKKPPEIGEMKKHLYDGNPVVISAVVDHSFHDLDHRDDVWDTWDRFKGFHAMVVVGYDDRRQAFLVMNSYGTDFGSNGYFWLTYELARKRVPVTRERDGKRVTEREYVIRMAYIVDWAWNRDLSGRWRARTYVERGKQAVYANFVLDLDEDEGGDLSGGDLRLDTVIVNDGTVAMIRMQGRIERSHLAPDDPVDFALKVEFEDVTGLARAATSQGTEVVAIHSDPKRTVLVVDGEVQPMTKAERRQARRKTIKILNGGKSWIRGRVVRGGTELRTLVSLGGEKVDLMLRRGETIRQKELSAKGKEIERRYREGMGKARRLLRR